MEPLLTSLIEHKNQEHVPLLPQVIQAKAPTIYEMIKHGDSNKSLKHSWILYSQIDWKISNW
jgi:hypothetical protein